MMSHLIAAVSAILWSLVHHHALGIRPREWNRYFKKSILLSMCYVGFCRVKSLRNLWNTGLAGSLCCAYDVVTDWRGFDPPALAAFRTVLARRVTSDLQGIAMDLAERDNNNQLQHDGLERGVITLQFILPLMGSLANIKREVDLQTLGLSCQIVDDILDIQEDTDRDELNCLLSPRANVYLDYFINNFPSEKIYHLFGRKTALSHAFTMARNKALLMRRGLATPRRERRQARAASISLRDFGGL